MKLLIAEDDLTSRLILQKMAVKAGYEPVTVGDGLSALKILSAPDNPKLALLDWVMPGMDGLEICRSLRTTSSDEPVYIILLTARDRKADVIAGLKAGANDYIIKPYDTDELRVRIDVGSMVVALQASLAGRIAELQAAMARIKTLHGIIPICSYCKKIRNDRQYWQEVEKYIDEHSDAQFSHGICPDCYEKHVLPNIECANNQTGTRTKRQKQDLDKPA